MANVLINENSMTAIANAIRAKNGTSTTYKPSEMAGAISAIDGGGSTPTGTIQITSNGTHDVSAYASANVAVPTGSTPTGTKQISITENGTTTEDVSAYANAEITVNVAGSSSSNKYTGTVTLEGQETAYLSIPISGHQLVAGENWIVFVRATKTGEYADGTTTWYEEENTVIPSGLGGYFLILCMMATNKLLSSGTLLEADLTTTRTGKATASEEVYGKVGANASAVMNGRIDSLNGRTNTISLYSGNAAYKFCSANMSIEYTYEAYLLD